jgi:cation:H+ antiporter
MTLGSGLKRRERLSIALALLTLVPFVATVVFGFGRDSALVVVVVTGLGMAAASFELAWGTESLQFVVSQVLALAVLATLQVLPEYSVDAALAYNGASDPIQLHFATASMTGANRLLLGAGWPVVFFVSYLASRGENPKAGSYLQLEREQALEVLFLGISTLYSFFIVAKGTLDLLDAAVLILIFASYVYLAARIPPLGKERLEEMGGVALAVGRMRRSRRNVVILSLVTLGGLVTILGAQPFVGGLIEIGGALGVSEFLLIQWLAPFLTEFPETVTVLYWAARSNRGSLAMGNLISSKLNQWTLLVGTIPIVYNIALARFQSIALSQLQSSELFLTASQSIYGVVCLLDLQLSWREALSLIALFLLQFFIPPLRLEVSAAYLILAAFELVQTQGRIAIFRQVKEILREYVHKRPQE